MRAAAKSATKTNIAKRRVRWGKAYRIISTRYPPIHLFERIAPSDDWDALIQLEMLTNPRLRDEIGNISLVPPNRRVSGDGASIVMAPFTHTSTDRPTRFSRGAFGIYYAAKAFETALAEVAHHRVRFHRATNDPPTDSDFRVYVGKVDRALHDLRGPGHAAYLDPDDYTAAQVLAEQLRSDGSNGIVYPSVRHPTGECIAAFWPDVVGMPTQERHISMKWDGRTITHWFDYSVGKWNPM